MADKIIKEMPFKTGFSNLAGAVIPKCCMECATAKFYYDTCCAGVMVCLDCKAWNRCPLRNKETKEEADG